MSTAATSFGDVGDVGDVGDEVRPCDRLETLFDEIAELMGQRNAIDGRLVQIVAEIDGKQMWGSTGCRSIAALVAWRTGMAPRNAETVVAIANRIKEFPRLTQGMAQGRLSLDQVGVIAEYAADGSDEHYAALAPVATVTQLRTAVKLEPRPAKKPKPEPKAEFTRIEDGEFTTYRIRLPKVEAAKFDAAHRAHRDGLIADWKRDRDPGFDPEAADAQDEQDERMAPPEQAPPFPSTVEAFMSLVEAGWDTEVAARPHSAHATLVVHVDVDKPVASLHLGPLLSDDERQFLGCDATCEVWFERCGQLIGSGRTTRTISRRLRRALEHRDTTCVVPGCGATRGLHAHHIVHWENGGATEFDNMVLVCPFHHRLHHKGGITITGPADRLAVSDSRGRQLTGGSLARPPTGSPPDVPPCRGPLGEDAEWWWYTPFEPPADSQIEPS